MTDLYPPDALAAMRQTVDQAGDGWRWPFPGFEELAKNASLAGLGEPERAVIAAKAVPSRGPHTPSRCVSSTQTPMRRRTGSVLIACDDMRGLIAAGVPQIAAMAAPPWHYLELADRPLADVLGARRRWRRCWTGWQPAGAATRSNHPFRIGSKRPYVGRR